MSVVHIAFEKTADTFIKKIVKAFAGPYVHTEMIVSTRNSHVAYSAYMSENFSRTENFDFNDEKFDFLLLPLSSEEAERISSTCEACVKSKIPYNTRDMVFSQVPFRHPTEEDIFHAHTLFCSQALVLVLRSCLDKDHVLQANLATVNSRTVSPSQVFSILSPHCKELSGLQINRNFLRSV